MLMIVSQFLYACRKVVSVSKYSPGKEDLSNNCLPIPLPNGIFWNLRLSFVQIFESTDVVSMDKGMYSLLYAIFQMAFLCQSCQVGDYSLQHLWDCRSEPGSDSHCEHFGRVISVSCWFSSLCNKLFPSLRTWRGNAWCPGVSGAHTKGAIVRWLTGLGPWLGAWGASSRPKTTRRGV